MQELCKVAFYQKMIFKDLKCFLSIKKNLVEVSNDKPIKVAIKGEWKGHNNGRFKVDDKDLNSMIDNFNQKD
ncbi:hypothetical protein B10628_20140 [Campylobacter jejuni]|nr:hypothetical protein B10628_20140 [Campylobacter jejuni]